MSRRFGLVIVALACTFAAKAADKVWFDEKAYLAEMKSEFGASNKLAIRQDKWSLGKVTMTRTEKGGLQSLIGFTDERDTRSKVTLLLEFDKKGQLIFASCGFTYNQKGYGSFNVGGIGQGITPDMTRQARIEKVGDLMQSFINNQKLTVPEGSRPPNFGAATYYMIVTVAKHVWFGPKVTDHRTSRPAPSGPPPRRGKPG